MNTLNHGAEESYSLLSVRGAVTQSVVEESAAKLRSALSELKLSETSSAGIHYVFIEMAQNICKYASETLDGSGCGEITVTLSDGLCVLESRNCVDSAVSNHLDRHLKRITALNREELRRLFSELIREGEKSIPDGASARNGGGVGLVQIAQTAAAPLDYCFRRTGGTTEFILRATLRAIRMEG